MIKATLAGLIYFLMVFAVGFLLGIFRTLLLAPYSGELIAVAIELPIILIIAWLRVSGSSSIDRCLLTSQDGL